MIVRPGDTIGKLIINTASVMVTSLLHDLDFYAWTQQQVDLLKSGNLGDVDVKHLIEGIESMGASERRELINQLFRPNVLTLKMIY